jgi:hypothetical protein
MNFYNYSILEIRITEKNINHNMKNINLKHARTITYR